MDALKRALLERAVRRLYYSDHLLSEEEARRLCELLGVSFPPPTPA